MPAKSRAQQELMAIAEHEPGKLYQRNRGVLKMSHEQLHDFAATPGLKRKPIKLSRASARRIKERARMV